MSDEQKPQPDTLPALAASPGEAPGKSWDEIFAEDDGEIERQEVPEWGTHVYLRTLRADVALELLGKISTLPPERDHEALFLTLEHTLLDANKQPLTKDLFEKLRARRLEPLGRLNKRAQQMQGWDKAVREAQKNSSGGTAAAVSPSA